MKIYIDSEYKCHVTPGEGLVEVETDFFDGKAPGYIEGYRYVQEGQSWVRSDGVVFTGEMIAPWRPFEALEATQMAYERERYDNLIAELSEVYENADS